METRQPHYQLSPELPPTPGPEAGPTFNPAPQENISPQSSDPQVFEAGRYSPETRARMSEAQKGKKHSPETRAKISEARKGKKHSPESRAKISEAKKGERNPNYGKKHSSETRAKISEAQKGKKHHRYDQSIDKVRLAIADHVRGESLAQASRNQGFNHNWLCIWKSKHPERFQAIYMEGAVALDQLTIQRAIGAHALGASIWEASLSVGMETDWLPAWKKAHPDEFQRLLDREQSGIGLTRQVLDLRYDENLAVAEASQRLELEPDQLD